MEVKDLKPAGEKQLFMSPLAPDHPGIIIHQSSPLTQFSGGGRQGNLG